MRVAANGINLNHVEQGTGRPREFTREVTQFLAAAGLGRAGSDG